MRRAYCAICLILLMLLIQPQSLRADWLRVLKPKPEPSTTSTLSAPLTLMGLSQEQVAQALKEALANGVAHAITNLGQNGGFLSNQTVRIALPENLSRTEKTLRAVGQGRVADQFIASINHAAEASVPEAGLIFRDALHDMSLQDAKSILQGPEDAATQYFKKNGEKRIQEKMLPVIRKYTAQCGVTSNYKKFIGHLRLSNEDSDLDSYITQKASDGLFKMVAEEEKRIRQTPSARTTELMQRIFSVR